MRRAPSSDMTHYLLQKWQRVHAMRALLQKWRKVSTHRIARFYFDATRALLPKWRRVVSTQHSPSCDARPPPEMEEYRCDARLPPEMEEGIDATRALLHDVNGSKDFLQCACARVADRAGRPGQWERARVAQIEAMEDRRR
jgi:hypothetical protein